MLQTKVTTIGDSVGIVLPKEEIEKLRVKKGDIIYFCKNVEGYSLNPYDENFLKQMTLAEQIMHDDHDVLKVLANNE